MQSLVQYASDQSDNLLKSLRRLCSRTGFGKGCFAIIAFILIEPAWFNEFPILDTVFIVAKLALTLVSLVCLMRSNHRTIVVLVAIYGAYLVGDTILHNGDTISSVKHAVNSICFISLPLSMLEIHQDNAFEAFRITFDILLVCNLISVLVAPDGLYQVIRSTGWTSNACWFLGIRNGMPPIYVTAACLEYAAVAKSNYSKKSIMRCAAVLIAASLTIVLINYATVQYNNTSSAGGFLVIWVMVLAVPVLQRIKYAKKLIRYSSSVFINYVIAFLLVVVRIQNAFSVLIVDVLGKDLTLSNRTYIWDAAIGKVKDSLMFGFGIQPETTMATSLNSAAAVSTTHNGWLDMFYIGGIVLVIIILGIFLNCGAELAKQKCDTEGVYLLGCYTGIYLFTGQTEALIGPRFFLFFSLLIILSRALGTKGKLTQSAEAARLDSADTNKGR